MRIFLTLFLLMLSTLYASADISGNGCKIGEGYIYTEYLGLGYPYIGQPGVRYYNSNGPKIPFYWGHGQNLHRGYRCGYINVYGASSYWDADKQQNVPIPAENEFTFLGSNCAIAPNKNSPPVATDSYVHYTYMKTNMCATNPTPVPLDDYAAYVLIGASVIGYFIITRKEIMKSLTLS